MIDTPRLIAAGVGATGVGAAEGDGARGRLFLLSAIDRVKTSRKVYDKSGKCLPIGSVSGAFRKAIRILNCSKASSIAL